MLAVHSPLTYQPLIPKERLMVIAGAGDRLAPPKHARLLWGPLGQARIHWFPGNHLLHLDKGKYLKEIARFLRKSASTMTEAAAPCHPLRRVERQKSGFIP